MTKIRLALGLLFSILTLGILAAPVVAPISSGPVAPIAQPVAAEAGSNFGKVVNQSGAPVRIDCNYGQGPYYTLYELTDSRSSFSDHYCSDTDRFYGYYDLRCIYYGGPGYTDGWYKLQANVWRKVAGLAKVDVYAYTSARCGSRPYFTYV